MWQHIAPEDRALLRAPDEEDIIMKWESDLVFLIDDILSPLD